MADPEPANSRKNEILLGVGGFVGAFLLVLVWPRGNPIEQPVVYNHQVHLDAGLECGNCHTLYPDGPWAGLPTIDTCSLCHSEVSGDSLEEAKIVEYVQREETPQWHQINQLPTHVYFSHQTHVVAAGMECTTCHGEMRERTVPPTKPYFKWTMDVCLNCHEQRSATLDCDGCHR